MPISLSEHNPHTTFTSTIPSIHLIYKMISIDRHCGPWLTLALCHIVDVGVVWSKRRSCATKSRARERPTILHKVAEWCSVSAFSVVIHHPILFRHQWAHKNRSEVIRQTLEMDVPLVSIDARIRKDC